MFVNETLNLVFCAMPDLKVGIPAERVAALDSDSDGVECRDLADILGLVIDGPRRRLRVRGEPDFDLLVGGDVSVREVSRGDVQPVPALIRGLASSGLLGVLIDDSTFALVYDPSKWATRAADE